MTECGEPALPAFRPAPPDSIQCLSGTRGGDQPSAHARLVENEKCST